MQPRSRGSILFRAASVPWTTPRYVTSVTRRNSSGVHFLDRRKDANHGVIDPDIDRSELPLDLFGRCLHPGCIGHVHWQNEGLSACLFNLALRSYQSVKSAGD